MTDWKKKLTSRKFWAAICALATNLILAFGGSEDTTVKVTAIIMAGASVIAYIIGEGLVDASRTDAGTVVLQLPEEKPPEEEPDNEPEAETEDEEEEPEEV